jgi:anionic cell wall polymer biosynthesis LytR-Cps2A-Psr (LCP) family protein
MRSRHYKWFDPKTMKWTSDGSSDWGRISRQQDFMKRVIRKSLEKAKTNPRVASGILNAALKNIITDDRLSPLTVLQLGQAMKNFNTDTMGSYTMPGTGTLIDDMSVILPDLESATSKKILAVFQGKASLKTTIAGASPADNATVTTTTLAALATTTTVASKSTPTTKPAQSSTTTTVPKVAIEQSARGVVPPNDINCQY